ncbi:hypothetical protein D9M71_647940 [compost metagenome]
MPSKTAMYLAMTSMPGRMTMAKSMMATPCITVFCGVAAVDTGAVMGLFRFGCATLERSRRFSTLAGST